MRDRRGAAPPTRRNQGLRASVQPPPAAAGGSPPHAQLPPPPGILGRLPPLPLAPAQGSQPRRRSPTPCTERGKVTTRQPTGAARSCPRGTAPAPPSTSASVRHHMLCASDLLKPALVPLGFPSRALPPFRPGGPICGAPEECALAFPRRTRDALVSHWGFERGWGVRVHVCGVATKDTRGGGASSPPCNLGSSL